MKTKEFKTGAAACAASIKPELIAKFPLTKFSVRSETFSMGNAVRISWQDGPTTKEVEDITDKYQYGHFNGMEDIYENSNRRDDIPQAKYITTSRNMSEPSRLIFETWAKERHEANDKYNTWDASNLAYRLFVQCSLYGINAFKIVPTGADGGLNSPEVFYKVEGEKQPEPTQTSQTEPVKIGDMTISHNEEKDGIELRFDNRPGENVLILLKSNGWRWSSFNKVWYNRYNEQNYNFATSLQDVKTEPSPENNTLQSLVPRSARQDIRLEKAARRYAARVRSGANTVRYY